MSIPNYLEPQLNLAQYLDRLQSGAVTTRRAIAIGPRMLLSRYGYENTQATTYRDGGVTGTPTVIPYTYESSDGVYSAPPAGYTVDYDEVEVHASELHAFLATYNSDLVDTGNSPPGKPNFYVLSASEPNVLMLGYALESTAGGGPSATYQDALDWYSFHRSWCLVRDVSGDENVDDQLHGYNLQVGDVVYITDESGGTVFKRTISGFRGVTSPSKYGTDSDYDNQEFAASASNPALNALSDVSTVYGPSNATATIVEVDFKPLNILGATMIQGQYAEEFLVTCTTPGAPGTAKVSITTLSGKFSALNVETVVGDDANDYHITISYDGTDVATVGIDYDAGQTMARGDAAKFRVFPAYSVMDPTAVFTISGSLADRRYSGPKDTTYFIEVTQGNELATDLEGVSIKVYDSAGIEEVAEYDLGAAGDYDATSVMPIGTFGIQVTLADPAALGAGGFRAGDKWYIHAKAETTLTDKFDKIILDGPAASPGSAPLADPEENPIYTLSFYKPYTGDIDSDDASDTIAWVADSSGVTLEDGLALYVSGRDTGYEWCTFKDNQGSIYLSWGAFVPVTSSDTFTLCSSDAEIAAAAGTDHPDNPLGYGASEVFSGAQGEPIYVLNTGGDSLAAFTAAFAKIEATKIPYALAVITEDATVKAQAKAHVEAMSAKAVKHFRRAYVGTDSPGLYQYATEDSEGDDLAATFTDYGGQGNLLVTFGENTTLQSYTLYAGDLVRVTNQDGSYDSYAISSVLSNTELLVSTGPTNPIDPARTVEIWKADTAANTVDFVKAASASLGSRRVCNVWCDNGTKIIDGTTRVIENKYLACEIAGLRMAAPSWIGLTRTEITGVTSCPSMYTRFTKDQLNEIAAAGTFIVTQDIESGAIYIRHQLTTDADNGSLYYEDSVGVNLDTISYDIVNLLDAYIGKYNVTQETLIKINNDVAGILDVALRADPIYGPQLINYDNLTVSVHPVFRDRITVAATLRMPLPLNYIDVELYAEADFSL